jgi:hypothetical protein
VAYSSGKVVAKSDQSMSMRGACSAQVQTQNKHNREAKGVREK